MKTVNLQAVAALAVALAAPAQALDARCPQLSDDGRGDPAADPPWLVLDWPRVIEACVPALENDRGKRWPLVLGDSRSADVPSDKAVRALLERGIALPVRLDPAMIPVAQAIQRAGAPVVVVDARSGTWPYDLVGDPGKWALSFPEKAQVQDAWRRMPVPGRAEGWQVAADRLRSVLQRFRDAGVRVDAVWLDHDGTLANVTFDAAKASKEAGKEIPALALRDPETFNRYRRQLWSQLLSAYVAAPVREVFPAASITTRGIVASSKDVPTLGSDGTALGTAVPTLFTATAPAAYGLDVGFHSLWSKEPPGDPAAVDRGYLHLLLRQVSADTANRRVTAPALDAVASVARWMQDLPDRPAPPMGRPMYREALRHLWLRGVDAMQVQNGARRGALAHALAEVQDAAAVYDELLKYRDFLDQGDPINLDVPPPEHDGVVWSGLRLGDHALLRVVSLGVPEQPVEISAWDGFSLAVPATPAGTTYIVRLNREAGRMEVVTSDPPPPGAPAPEGGKKGPEKRQGNDKREEKRDEKRDEKREG